MKSTCIKILCVKEKQAMSEWKNFFLLHAMNMWIYGNWCEKDYAPQRERIHHMMIMMCMIWEKFSENRIAWNGMSESVGVCV